MTGTHINYYFICKRKLWLFANGIQMEQTSDLVYEGKLIHETTYPQRSGKYEEIQIGGAKVDFYDAKNNVIHEIKKSNKDFIYTFEKAGMSGVSGILEYPKLRKTEEVYLSNIDRERIKEIEIEIREIISSENCPEKIDSKICKRCSYFDFCFANEIN